MQYIQLTRLIRLIRWYNNYVMAKSLDLKEDGDGALTSSSGSLFQCEITSTKNEIRCEFDCTKGLNRG